VLTIQSNSALQNINALNALQTIATNVSISTTTRSPT